MSRVRFRHSAGGSGSSSFATMRLGVLDVGSNTVHLLVVDAHAGARPIPATSHKTELRLSENIGKDGRITAAGADLLVRFVASCTEVAEDNGVEDIIAFATSAIREAPNGDDVLARVRAETGVDLQVLAGGDEARLTFLAVRRWFGWSVGGLLLLDIGGGSLELAAGIDEVPDVAVSSRSAPAGSPGTGWPATRRTPTRCAPRAGTCAPRWAVSSATSAGPGRTTARWGRARRSGRWPGCAGRRRPATGRTCREHRRRRPGGQIPELARMTVAERMRLPGVSAGRAASCWPARSSRTPRWTC